MIVIQFRRKMYGDPTFIKKVKLPLGAYLIILFLSVLPIIGFIADGLAIWFFIAMIKEREAFYKPGWFVKLLSKEI